MLIALSTSRCLARSHHQVCLLSQQGTDAYLFRYMAIIAFLLKAIKGQGPGLPCLRLDRKASGGENSYAVACYGV